MESQKRVQLSVVVPVYNESENIAELTREIVLALAVVQEGWEIIYVDDCSNDDTLAQLYALQQETPSLKIVRHRFNAGQSAAVASGFKAAAGEWVGTLDGDGQNDPADLPILLNKARKEGVDCVTGVRAKRQDNWLRKLSSLIANGFRNIATGERVSDSACGIRVIKKAALAEIPVFNGMHRFLPTLLKAQGFTVLEQVVNHRQRLRGVSKYGMHNRLWRGIRDCFAIRWYKSRAFPAVRLCEDEALLSQDRVKREGRQ